MNLSDSVRTLEWGPSSEIPQVSGVKSTASISGYPMQLARGCSIRIESSQQTVRDCPESPRTSIEGRSRREREGQPPPALCTHPTLPVITSSSTLVQLIGTIPPPVPECHPLYAHIARRNTTFDSSLLPRHRQMLICLRAVAAPIFYFINRPSRWPE